MIATTTTAGATSGRKETETTPVAASDLRTSILAGKGRRRSLARKIFRLLPLEDGHFPLRLSVSLALSYFYLVSSASLTFSLPFSSLPPPVLSLFHSLFGTTPLIYPSSFLSPRLISLSSSSSHPLPVSFFFYPLLASVTLCHHLLLASSLSFSHSLSRIGEEGGSELSDLSVSFRLACRTSGIS